MQPNDTCIIEDYSPNLQSTWTNDCCHFKPTSMSDYDYINHYSTSDNTTTVNNNNGTLFSYFSNA